MTIKNFLIGINKFPLVLLFIVPIRDTFAVRPDVYYDWWSQLYQPRGVRGESVQKMRNAEFAQRRIQEEMGCGGMTRDTTCSPSAAPSYSLAQSDSPSDVPSSMPSVSFAPTESLAPSASPSLSMQPTSFPSEFPSSQPSEFPSESPTLSLTPSQAPTEIPSASPTSTPTISAAPSVTPSSEPTMTHAPTITLKPSYTPQPTMTYSPTPVPQGYSIVLFAGPDALPERNSTCRISLPQDVTMVQEQLVAFNYITNVSPGSNITLSMNTISLRLQSELSRLYLTCDFIPESNFYTYAISSLPTDVLDSQVCSDTEKQGNNDCYIVDGTFIATIFYLPSERRRKLEGSTISDPAVLQSFSTSLEEIFASGALTSERVVSTTYEGITNSVVNSSSESSTRNKGAIAGGVVGGMLAVVLILALAYFVGTREKQESNKDEKDRNKKKELEEEEVLLDENVIKSTDEQDDILSLSRDETKEEEKLSVAESAQEEQEEEEREVNKIDVTTEKEIEVTNEKDATRETEVSDVGIDKEYQTALQEKLEVVVVNQEEEDEESLAHSLPLRRPRPEEPDDTPPPPRFHARRELTPHSSPKSPRSYDLSDDTVDL